MKRPIVGLTVSREAPDPERDLFRGKALQYIEEGMLRAVAVSGCRPLLLPCLEDDARSVELLECCDALLLSGGADLAPSSYGEEPRSPAWAGDAVRDAYEIALYQEARRLGLPVLGICRGCQLMAVAHGGSLFQDIDSDVEAALRHRDPQPYDKLEHAVELLPGTRLARLLGEGTHTVNSVHHQAVRQVGSGLRIAARAPDGVIEAVEGVDEGRFVMGIQWHPEWIDGAGEDPIFEAFYDSARERSAGA